MVHIRFEYNINVLLRNHFASSQCFFDRIILRIGTRRSFSNAAQQSTHTILGKNKLDYVAVNRRNDFIYLKWAQPGFNEIALMHSMALLLPGPPITQITGGTERTAEITDGGMVGL